MKCVQLLVLLLRCLHDFIPLHFILLDLLQTLLDVFFLLQLLELLLLFCLFLDALLCLFFHLPLGLFHLFPLLLQLLLDLAPLLDALVHFSDLGIVAAFLELGLRLLLHEQFAPGLAVHLVILMDLLAEDLHVLGVFAQVFIGIRCITIIQGGQ